MLCNMQDAESTQVGRRLEASIAAWLAGWLAGWWWAAAGGSRARLRCCVGLPSWRAGERPRCCWSQKPSAAPEQTRQSREAATACGKRHPAEGQGPMGGSLFRHGRLQHGRRGSPLFPMKGSVLLAPTQERAAPISSLRSVCTPSDELPGRDTPPNHHATQPSPQGPPFLSPARRPSPCGKVEQGGQQEQRKDRQAQHHSGRPEAQRRQRACSRQGGRRSAAAWHGGS